jgi:hypothetical protein
VAAVWSGPEERQEAGCTQHASKLVRHPDYQSEEPPHEKHSGMAEFVEFAAALGGLVCLCRHPKPGFLGSAEH